MTALALDWREVNPWYYRAESDGTTVLVSVPFADDVWMWQPFGGADTHGFATKEDAMADAELWLASRGGARG